MRASLLHQPRAAHVRQLRRGGRPRVRSGRTASNRRVGTCVHANAVQPGLSSVRVTRSAASSNKGGGCNADLMHQHTAGTANAALGWASAGRIRPQDRFSQLPVRRSCSPAPPCQQQPASGGHLADAAARVVRARRHGPQQHVGRLRRGTAHADQQHGGAQALGRAPKARRSGQALVHMLRQRASSARGRGPSP